MWWASSHCTDFSQDHLPDLEWEVPVILGLNWEFPDVCYCAIPGGHFFLKKMDALLSWFLRACPLCAKLTCSSQRTRIQGQWQKRPSTDMDKSKQIWSWIANMHLGGPMRANSNRKNTHGFHEARSSWNVIKPLVGLWWEEVGFPQCIANLLRSRGNFQVPCLLTVNSQPSIHSLLLLSDTEIAIFTHFKL